MGIVMPGDLKVVHIKQVFRFNSVHINEVPLYVKPLSINRFNISKKINF